MCALRTTLTTTERIDVEVLNMFMVRSYYDDIYYAMKNLDLWHGL